MTTLSLLWRLVSGVPTVLDDHQVLTQNEEIDQGPRRFPRRWYCQRSALESLLHFSSGSLVGTPTKLPEALIDRETYGLNHRFLYLLGSEGAGGGSRGSRGLRRFLEPQS